MTVREIMTDELLELISNEYELYKKASGELQNEQGKLHNLMTFEQYTQVFMQKRSNRLFSKGCVAIG